MTLRNALSAVTARELIPLPSALGPSTPVWPGAISTAAVSVEAMPPCGFTATEKISLPWKPASAESPSPAIVAVVSRAK